MFTDKEIIAELKSWIGTKWKHGVALKGFGTDCVQFIVKIGKQFEWIPKSYEPPKYHKDWALHNSKSILLSELSKFACQLENKQYQVGDVFVFTYGKTQTHAGIYIGNGIIVHSHIRHGVISSDYRDIKDGKLHSIWRLR